MTPFATSLPSWTCPCCSGPTDCASVCSGFGEYLIGLRNGIEPHRDQAPPPTLVPRACTYCSPVESRCVICRQNGGGLLPERRVLGGWIGQALQEAPESAQARVLPDGGGRCAQASVPGDPGADSTAANAQDGARMMTTTVETAGGGGGDGHSLPVAGPNAWRKWISGTIIDRQRLDIPSRKARKRLLIPTIVIKSSGRPAMVAGVKLSGNPG